MQVTMTKPNISQYYFQFDSDDEIYGRCLWQTINLDHDQYTMTAHGDCGSYSYSWHITDSETFLHLMCRIDEDYLLNKISSPSIFDLKKSKEGILSRANDYAWSGEQLQQIEDLHDCSPEGFYYFCTKDLGMHGEDVPIEVLYPTNATTFVEIFTDYLQPLLREGAR